jgi:hypothetical protein
VNLTALLVGAVTMIGRLGSFLDYRGWTTRLLTWHYRPWMWHGGPRSYVAFNRFGVGGLFVVGGLILVITALTGKVEG